MTVRSCKPYAADRSERRRFCSLLPSGIRAASTVAPVERVIAASTIASVERVIGRISCRASGHVIAASSVRPWCASLPHQLRVRVRVIAASAVAPGHVIAASAVRPWCASSPHQLRVRRARYRRMSIARRLRRTQCAFPGKAMAPGVVHQLERRSSLSERSLSCRLRAVPCTYCP